MDFHRILYGTDFSPFSEDAFRVASALARDSNATLIILHVSELEDYPVGELFDEEMKAPVEDAARLRALAVQAGAPCECRWVHRKPPHEAEAIVEAAEHDGADLIVVGTHGRRGWSHFLAGSVAEKVVRTAKCPVLTVRQRMETPVETS